MDTHLRSTRRRHKGIGDKSIQHDSSSLNEEKLHRFQSSKPYGFRHALGFCILLCVLGYAVLLSDNFLPESKPIDFDLKSFSGDRGRQYLNALTAIGPRPAGSYECDVLAVEYLFNQLSSIKNKANKGFFIDIDVQVASGTFAFIRRSRMLEFGFTSTYDDVTNVLVKISSNSSEDNFVLLNAHFDTVMGTEGASDDAVSCAVLMETFRAVSKMDPANLKHGLIFLFNGGEEGGLAGSHAFVSRHDWVSRVKVVINVEAAGSGGRESVFQTGPEHPWIIDAYATSAKYPFASVVAQEIFQSGIIPSDTDFRVFVEYGNLVGVDLAFISNGYVYHTRYDDAKSIPSGSIQRAGDNIYNLAIALVNSPYLENPAAYKHGSSVFFDVLGVFVVHYPKRLHILMNYITVAVIVLFLLKKLFLVNAVSGQMVAGQVTVSTDINVIGLMVAVGMVILSWLCAFACAFVLSYIMIKFNALMTWYSSPYFGLILYGCPALFGMLLVHYLLQGYLQKIAGSSIGPIIFAHLLIFCCGLLYFNYEGLLSSYMLWLWTVCPFFFTCILADGIPFLPEKKNLAVYLLHLVSSIIPVVISLYHIRIVFNFFVPLLGRSGTELPGEYVLAVLSAVTVIVTFSLMTGTYHHVRNMASYLVFLAVACLFVAGYALRGQMRPYSIDNPVTPKRLFMVHTLRTFHNSDGTVLKQDSGIFLNPIDYLGIKPLENVPFYNTTEMFECDGPYCGIPYYYALRKIVRQQWYLRGERPEWEHKPLSTDVYTREVVASDVVRFTFSVKGPDHMGLFLTLIDSVQLHDWSFYKSNDGHMYSIPDHFGGNTHFVFYTHGYNFTTDWKFWIELKHSELSTVKLAELGIARHYLHGVDSRTSFLRKAIKALPSWVSETAWTANYDTFLLS